MNTSDCEEEALASNPCKSAANEYARRLQVRQRQLASIRSFHRRLWIYLSATALGGIAVIWAALSSHIISRLWIVLPCMVALSLLRALGKNAQLHGRVERIVRFYELGVARLSHQWQGRGVAGDDLRPAEHSYASDLDLFGAGSLFELLCTARTGIGRATLANWLLYPAQCEEVAERQGAIAELRGALDLREEWASIKGGALDRGATSLREWVKAPAIRFPFYAKAFASFLPICLIVVSLFAGAGAFGH